MPKQEQQRAKGQYGFGAYKDEPWSMQVLESASVKFCRGKVNSYM